MAFLHWIDNIDKRLFTFIHQSLANNFLDAAMLFLRNPLVWIPLYAFLLFWLLKYHRTYAVKFIVLSVVTVGFTDYVSASVLKELIKRPRPCHSVELLPVIRNIIDCGGLYGFPSSHASNHFGMAAFWFCAIFTMTGKKWHWLWIWAALISFAQVYVGKHYPFDVLCGALFGLGSGWVAAMIFKRWVSPKNQQETPGKLGATGSFTN